MSRYSDAIKRLSKALERLSDEYDRPKIFFWLDALWSHIRYGVTPNEYVGFDFCEKSALERKQFYTARHQRKTESFFNEKCQEENFDDKHKFNTIFKDFVKRDWIYCYDSTTEEIENFIKSHGKIFAKPPNLSSGRGGHVYNNEPAEWLKQNKILLEEFIVQNSLISELNPTSVNTVRVYTVLDKDGKCHILSASLRVGGSGSEVDNFHAGGVGYPIDVETGTICAAGKSIGGERFLFHPGTGKKVIGFEIPYWDRLTAFVFKATQVIPSARLVAWDVAVLEDGNFEMVEGNSWGDPGLMQTPLGKGKYGYIKDIKRGLI